MTKELCKCGKRAVWDYMPGYSNGDHPYFCDDCVGRGCECNHRYVKDELFKEGDPPEGEEGNDWIWIEEGKIWTNLDKMKREYPCAEYDYDPDGFGREINPHKLN
jgi:hypothetical protein